MEEIFTFKNVDYDIRNNASLKIVNLKLKPFPRLSPEFQTGLQMNALVECAKTMLQKLVSSDRY